ncbi:hydroxymethylpyrimidine/phosphomethylpyrimidine kinase [Marinospirillum celere]|uniref:hydroxymethylpyrimidine kinase n=1 Tax=Marinospirillum celere TaxID=1122252 RepID=A0A1I1IF71_9GAMM|nr:hydroxymethylpyrimidine/phosphomethylpyrimidine kinase [Marinospirillum celere]SFC34292.1 hydroxymethylpyrimidine/phosphomethylpyrimidine kinase [Marinospirillum celere]
MLEPGTNQHFQKKYPCVLAIGGHDPSGGAGILADAQAMLTLKAWPLTLITALTSQNSHSVVDVYPQNPDAFEDQLETLTADLRPQAVKIGVTGSLAIQQIIGSWLRRNDDIPLILDPVIASTSGKRFLSDEQLYHWQDQLLPRATLVTPNLPELALLVPGKSTTDEKARKLIQTGCRAVLVTGTHAETQAVRNQLYLSLESSVQNSRWPRLPHEYHGSGCTLAAAITALIARGESLEIASQVAQDFTWHSLKQALKLSEGQHLPLRIKDIANV